MHSTEVRLNNITKAFGNTVAVDRLDLEIHQGEFFAMLGPSGCGKTTTLRMIAGLEEPTKGSIYISGQEITDLPTHKRNIGMVFQDYGLFPHMTVFDNIAFGLKMRGWPRPAMKQRVIELLDLIQLPGIAGRYPQQLSGGQKQRVALARSLAPQPTVLLLDEPMSNLDAKLRQELRLEFRRIQKELRITTIFVTHDQAEALSLSDRVLVMKSGRAVQLGSPLEIYEYPKTRWVASFLGDANLFQGQLRANGSRSTYLSTEDGLDIHLADKPDIEKREITIAIRPEAVKLFPLDTIIDPDRYSAFTGKIDNLAYEGANTRYVIRMDTAPSQVVYVDSHESDTMWMEGTRLQVAFPKDQWIFLND